MSLSRIQLLLLASFIFSSNFVIVNLKPFSWSNNLPIILGALKDYCKKNKTSE